MPWNGNSYKHVTLQKHHIFSGVILKDKSFSSVAVYPISIAEWVICVSQSRDSVYYNIFQGVDNWEFCFWFFFVCLCCGFGVFFDDKSWANHYFWLNLLFQNIWCYLAGLWAQRGSLFFSSSTPADSCWKRYWDSLCLNGIGLGQSCASLLWWF